MSLADLRIPRQKVILGAGLGLVATVLAACSTYGKKPEASGDTATATTEAASRVSRRPAPMRDAR
jgi:hypothetical protein